MVTWYMSAGIVAVFAAKLLLFLCLACFSQTYQSYKYEVTKWEGRDTSVVVVRNMEFSLSIDVERSDYLKMEGFQFLYVRYGGNEDIYRLWDDHNDGFRKFRGEAVDTKDYIDFEIHKNEIEPYLILRITTRRGETIKEAKYYL